MDTFASPLSVRNFGENFQWGVATAAAQIEGAFDRDGRSPSIWDTFARRKGKIRSGHHPMVACDFYHRFKDDLLLTKALGFTVFRFSVSWSRILPEGVGKPNREGLAFYHKVIDECLKLGLVPYLTLYHWDLPQVLEKQGGWANHRIVRWFSRFSAICAEEYGSKVKNWIILNEPAAFTSLGYMLGKHAPGKTGLGNFLPTVLNAALAQAEGGRVIRSLVPAAHIGTSFSCSEVIPNSGREEDLQSARLMDVLLNRLFIEPSLGRGFPKDDFRILEKIEFYNKAWKYTEQMTFNFDFIGIQNYFPLVIKYNPLIPLVQASEVKAASRKVPHTSMGWEINGQSLYRMLKRYWLYGTVKEIIITENGAAFRDECRNGVVDDMQRIAYFEEYLLAIRKAKREGVNIGGYFAWTLMDNFEWAEGYHARFGLIHVDFKTQLRTIKNSGYWFRDFLSAK